MTAVSIVVPQPVPPDFFASNVQEGDFLGSRVALPAVDLIVGNPPYVPTTRLTAEVKDDYRSRFQTANGRIDLYYLFFERALQHLPRGGTLAFITPNKLLTNVSASPLRNLLRTEGHVRTIAEFSSHKVFAEAATVPCVTVVTREPNAASRPRDVDYLRCTGTDASIRVGHRSRHPLPPTEWRLGEPDAVQLLQRLRSKHPALADCVTRISAGIATGRDSIFVLPQERADELGIEQTLRYPAVRGKDVDAGKVAQSGLEVIIPYVDDEGPHPRLVDLDAFPNTARYLAQHRRELDKRHCVRTWGKAWYDLHDPWKTNIAVQDKILVPDVAFANRFAVDTLKSCPLHSCYYLVPNDGVDIAYLTAVLNSLVIEFIIRATAPVVKDGFVRYRKQFLAPLPVPTANAKNRARFLRARDRRKATLDLFDISAEDFDFMETFIERSRGSHLAP